MQSIDKAKWSRFALLVMAGGTIYKLAYMKDVFYVPMQEYMGLSNTEIGLLLTVNSIVATALFVVGGYLADRFQSRNVIPLGLVGAGAIGIYMSTFPGYNQLLILFAMLAFCADCLFWPALLKSVRQLGGSNEQGRMFGFLEGGRGLVDTVVAFTALGVFLALGSGMGGFRAAIVTFAAIDIAVGVLLFFLLGKTGPGVRSEHAEQSETELTKPKVLEALKTVGRMPQLWLVSLTVFMVYMVYVGLTYFIPYLSEIYGLPIALVGAFGVVNQYGLKIFGGPLGGYLADKHVGSSSRYLQYAFLALIPVMLVILLLPETQDYRVVVMVVCLFFSLIIYTMRGVFWAPMEEVRVSKQLSGTAFGVASLVGYAPGMFGYLMYGAILDANPGLSGYHIVFILMTIFALVGAGVAMTLIRFMSGLNQTHPQTSEPREA